MIRPVFQSLKYLELVFCKIWVYRLLVYEFKCDINPVMGYCQLDFILILRSDSENPVATVLGVIVGWVICKSRRVCL